MLSAWGDFVIKSALVTIVVSLSFAAGVFVGGLVAAVMLTTFGPIS